MARLFGTDGVRGVANVDLTPELTLRIGRAAGLSFMKRMKRPRVLIATDTRISGNMLESALAAGLLSVGADVIRCGILPTPAVAFLVGVMEAGAGAVISASHNPVEDNGIKFFGSDGYKLSDEQEIEIEALMDAEGPLPKGGDLGREHFLEQDAEERYVEHALNTLEGQSLAGLKVVIDCANGAAFWTSPQALGRAGAEVIVFKAEPDGVNINVGCGSTHPEVVAKLVVETGADVGLAHDGDADRVIAVDENGNVVDGDAILAILAIDLKQKGKLIKDLLVATPMSNLGFRRAMAGRGIGVVEAQVGDRYVLEEMRRLGASIGGEQSGHVILTDYATTGDGLITGLKVLARMAETSSKLSELAGVYERYPQVMRNVSVSRKQALDSSDEIARAVAEARSKLGSEGRILVRPSGTEPLVRVMVEASNLQIADEVAGQVADIVERVLA